MPKALESPVIPITTSGSSPLEIEEPGPGAWFEGAEDTVPNSTVAVITEVAPSDLKLRRIDISCRAYGSWILTVDGTVCKSGYTSPNEAQHALKIEPWEKAALGQTVAVEFAQLQGPSVSVTARVHYTDGY